ncbi:MAG: response regulator [Candidatus Levybacteria bacterium]|nr:response regulator [Candidatus Levybacteria bacterium]
MKKSVLVVDDDPAILDVIKIILEEKGYDVHLLADGDKIAQTIVAFSPSVILLDFWLSGLNGKQVIKILRTNPTTKHIPIIMISANHDPKSIAEEVEANDFLAKPFDIDDLVRIVEKYTTSSSSGSQATQ